MTRDLTPCLLVTGASGMLGKALVDFAVSAEEFGAFKRILAIGGPYSSGNSGFKSEKVLFQRCDLAHKKDVEEIFATHKVEAIVHCAANTKVAECEENFEKALHDNTLSTSHLVDAAKSAHFIYVSSEAIYPETGSARSEKVPPQPINKYALSKHFGEILAQQLSKSTIIRTTIVGNASGHFADWVVSSALRSEPITLFDDVQFSPISVLQLARIIGYFVSQGVTGTFNVGSQDSCSKAAFAFQLLDRLGIPRKNCHVGQLKSQTKNSQRRITNMVLDSSKLLALYQHLPKVADVVEDLSNMGFAESMVSNQL